MNCVWCINAMQYFGRVAAEALGWLLFIDAPVPDCDTVYIIGMYDPPTYNLTLERTKRAKRRVIHWCGSDVQHIAPSYLPEALHIAESENLKRELWEHGIDSHVAMFPTPLHPPILPLPEVPTISAYFGSNPQKYGAQQLVMLQDVFKDVNWLTYQIGQYDQRQMLDVVANTTVHVRLTEHDGSATSVREMLEGGRYVVSNVDAPFVKRVQFDDMNEIIPAIATALKAKEPDTKAAEYYREFNKRERYLNDVGAVL